MPKQTHHFDAPSEFGAENQRASPSKQRSAGIRTEKRAKRQSFGYFLFISAPGRGKGVRRGRPGRGGGGFGFLLKNPGGGGSQEGVGGGEGVGRVFAGKCPLRSLKTKFLGRIFLGHQGPRRRDIPDPCPGTSPGKSSCKVPLSVVLDRDWPGCPAIWVGTSRHLGAHLGLSWIIDLLNYNGPF